MFACVTVKGLEYCGYIVELCLVKDRGELYVRLMCYFYSQLVLILVDACIHNVLTDNSM